MSTIERTRLECFHGKFHEDLGSKRYGCYGQRGGCQLRAVHILSPEGVSGCIHDDDDDDDDDGGGGGGGG